ncbi:hypothetical protein CRM79_00780 [Pantoea agglomerans]|nr:hypothetical protein CRM79_00780 [Pantoea agglomerans]
MLFPAYKVSIPEVIGRVWRFIKFPVIFPSEQTFQNVKKTPRRGCCQVWKGKMWLNICVHTAGFSD